MFHQIKSAIVGRDRSRIGRATPIVASHWACLILTAAVLTAIFSAAPATAGGLSFELSYIDKDNSWATSLDQDTLSDLNGDGCLDFTVGNVHTNPNLYWYEYQKPTNTWVKHLIASGNAIDPVFGGCTTLDVNGDGKLDIISSRFLFLNLGKKNGVTTFSRPYDIHAAAPVAKGSIDTQVHDHQAVDINGDGKLDLVSTTAYRDGNYLGGIYWYEAPADPTKPWASHLINVGVPPGYKGATHGTATGIHAATLPNGVGDLNGDGRPDVVSAMGWFENTPGTPASPGVGAGWTPHWNPDVFLGRDGDYNIGVRTSVQDLNGDGKLDIVQSECDTRGLARLAWLKNDGHGNFTRFMLRQGTKEDYHSLVVADFDNDGNLDIFTAAGPLGTGHAIYLLENTAGPGHDPVFVAHNLTEFLSPADAKKLNAAFATDHCHEPEFGDVDGDGKIDLVLKGWAQELKGSQIAPIMFLRNTTPTPELSVK